MNKKVIIGIIVAILIIAVVGGAYFMMNKNQKTDETENSGNQVKASNENTNTNNENITNTTNSTDRNANNTINNETSNEEETSDAGKTLIAYFSLPETTGEAKEDSTITVNGETLGNTQYVANLIQGHTGADIFRIEAVKQYNTADHQALIADAKEEQEADSRPEIKNTINNFDEYDTIFIGYPIWWSDLPQILYTFLESYDFSEKNVYLFSTNGGSGLAGTVSTITRKLNTANVNSNAFRLHRNSMESATREVEDWLKEINIIK